MKKNYFSEETKAKKIFRYLKETGYLKTGLSVVAGAGLGWLYYAFVGCSSGSCAITSSPVLSTIFGGFFGYLIVNRPCKSC